MHESSLIASLLTQVAQLVANQAVEEVEEIRLQVGPLAGVEPLLLREAFLRLREGTVAGRAELVIDAVGLTCQCRECRLTFTTEELRTCCPDCDAMADVMAGDAVVLESVKIRIFEECESKV